MHSCEVLKTGVFATNLDRRRCDRPPLRGSARCIQSNSGPHYGGRAGYGLISPVIITYRYVFSWSYRRTYKSTYAGLMNSNLRGLSWSVCEDFTRVILVHSEVYFGYIG